MMTNNIRTWLQHLITLPSFSREEDQTADYLSNILDKAGIRISRIKNNLIGKSTYWSDEKPTLLLNSHHDTVKPVESYTRDPFKATVEDDRLYGLGSNDAGASLCCLMQVFIDYHNRQDLPFNLLFIASAEEEISGQNGIELVLKSTPPIWGAIVGEPTRMKAAVAERGLMVVDGQSIGKSGHAARKEGINAIDLAIEDIRTIQNIRFDKKSEFLPDTQAIVTQIKAGSQHNVIPDSCRFVIDVRVNDQYSNQEVFHILKEAVKSELTARSFRLNSSSLPKDHALYKVVEKLDLKPFGSPTLSDQALMNFPSLKIGPGDSARSHTADEFVLLSEIEEGYSGYKLIIENLIKVLS